MTALNRDLFRRRRGRVRAKLRKVGQGRPRLSIFRSGKHIYAQVVDDEQGRTMAAASSKDKDVSAKIKTGANVEAAKAVGAVVAERAKKAGIGTVVFDRGGYIYHGRVRALAEAAREAGLKF